MDTKEKNTIEHFFFSFDKVQFRTQTIEMKWIETKLERQLTIAHLICKVCT